MVDLWPTFQGGGDCESGRRGGSASWVTINRGEDHLGERDELKGMGEGLYSTLGGFPVQEKLVQGKIENMEKRIRPGGGTSTTKSEWGGGGIEKGRCLLTLKGGGAAKLSTRGSKGCTPLQGARRGRGESGEGRKTIEKIFLFRKMAPSFTRGEFQGRSKGRKLRKQQCNRVQKV